MQLSELGGTLWTAFQISFWSFAAWDVCMYVAIFAGSAWSYERLRAKSTMAQDNEGGAGIIMAEEEGKV
jgi:hypothetical protein